jgi:hypothetical protein
MSIFGIGKSHKPMADVELLATIYDFGMRSVIESILRDADIPYILKERGGSLPVITGRPMLGADFFVRVEDIEAARELIAPCLEEDEDTDQ